MDRANGILLVVAAILAVLALLDGRKSDGGSSIRRRALWRTAAIMTIVALASSFLL